MLFRAGLPPFLQAEVFHHATRLHAPVLSQALPGCMTPIEQAIRCKPNLKSMLEFGAVMWARVKDAGKLEPQAVKGHFVGYDKESKRYCIYFPWHRSVIVKHNVYFDKDAVVDVGEVVFEGEMESTDNTDFSNPTVPAKAPISAPETHDMDAPAETIKTMLISAHITLPSIPAKPHRNSLAGLPQYDPNSMDMASREALPRRTEWPSLLKGTMDLR